MTGPWDAWCHTLWYQSAETAQRRLFGNLLAPLERLYGVLLGRDQAKRLRRRRRLPRCVVSVGNITVGGTGKTPTVLWIARTLHEAGLRSAVLSRGYGRAGSGVEKVSLHGPLDESARRFGDEPVLLARNLPWASVWVGTNRWEAGRRAIAEDRPDVLVLDDGFQHLQIHRDLDLVLLDAACPLGNGRLLPAGPLREPPHHLDRAHGVIIVGEKGKSPEPLEHPLPELLWEKPVFRARPVMGGFFRADTGTPLGWPENMLKDPCIAVAGIARPERFFSAVDALGVPCRERLAFSDHHGWTPSDVRRILHTMRATGARWIVTTEKDAVRMPPPLAKRAVYVAMGLDFGADAERLREILLEAVRSWVGR